MSNRSPLPQGKRCPEVFDFECRMGGLSRVHEFEEDSLALLRARAGWPQRTPAPRQGRSTAAQPRSVYWFPK